MTAIRTAKTRGDEEAFLWATAALGEARRQKKNRTENLLGALVEDLAFALGARSFPPRGAKASREGKRPRPARATWA